MTETLKIFIPMAGWGTRMRPHTWSKPKPLVGVAGKTSLDHLMEMFTTLPDPSNAEYVFIIGPYLGENQIPPHMAENYPDARVHYIVQTEMKGQSHALWLAREYMHGPMIMCFSDTLIETDFGFLAQETADGVAWVKSVPDPRRFGVAELDETGWVTRFIEKPPTVENDLAVVGCYYFKRAEALLAAIEEQIHKNVMLKNEYFLTDAITLMLGGGAKVRTHQVDIWLDTGTIDATLATNRFLLDHGRDNSAEAAGRENIKVIPPVFIHPRAQVSAAVIGPHVSIGPDCKIESAVIQDSIIEAGTSIERAALTGSLIGKNARISGQTSEGQALCLNVGDNSSLRL